jgi:IclR family pca regulon transcriptional regulator
MPANEYSRAVEYGAGILESFSAKRPAVGISEFADIIGVSRATSSRYAITLARLGYLEQDQHRRYRLSSRARVAGLEFIETLCLETPRARMILEELRDVTGYTISMGVLDGVRVLYIYRLCAHGLGQYEADLGLGVGAYVPAYCTAIGKALLASFSMPEQRKAVAALRLDPQGPKTIAATGLLREELLAIRAVGIAVCDEEQAPGVRSIAAPITHPGRSRPMAISVSIPARHMSIPTMRTKFEPYLKAAAERI